MSDWWTKMLDERKADGRRDAMKGVINRPYRSDDDPQNADENEAYNEGWWATRNELGDKFEWAEA
jgi:hypothetical protein